MCRISLNQILRSKSQEKHFRNKVHFITQISFFLIQINKRRLIFYEDFMYKDLYISFGLYVSYGHFYRTILNVSLNNILLR